MTKEIYAASEVRRELEGMDLPVELILLDPATAALTDFGNLEPMFVRSAKFVARSRAARSQADFHGTGVVVVEGAWRTPRALRWESYLTSQSRRRKLYLDRWVEGKRGVGQ